LAERCVLKQEVGGTLGDLRRARLVVGCDCRNRLCEGLFHESISSRQRNGARCRVLTTHGAPLLA
jgi:hypothetical protein